MKKGPTNIATSKFAKQTCRYFIGSFFQYRSERGLAVDVLQEGGSASPTSYHVSMQGPSHTCRKVDKRIAKQPYHHLTTTTKQARKNKSAQPTNLTLLP